MKSIPKNQWPDWIRTRLGDRKNALVRETGGRYYLYESKSYWDKELKRPRTKIKYVCRLKQYGNRIREHGHVALLQHLMEKHGITSSLKELFPEHWEELLLFSIDRMIARSPLKRMGSWAEKTTIEKVTGAPMGKKLSGALAVAGTDIGSQNAFMQDMMKTGDLLLYDGSVIYSTSGYNKLLEVGYDKDMSFKPKANISLLFSKKRNVPVRFLLFFGSVHEIRTMERISHEMRDHDIMFIADKGFYKNKLFENMPGLGIDFIVPLPRDDVRIEYSRKCTKIINYRKRMVAGTRYKSGDRWIYHYEDPMLRGVEINKYYKLKLAGRGVAFHEEWAGRISLLSNKKIPVKEAYLLWKSRDRIEKSFHVLQNLLETDKPYVSREDVFRGYMFVSFVSLIAYYLVLNLLKRREMNDAVSVDDLMHELSKIMVEDGDNPMLAEIPSKVENLARNLGIWDIVTKI